MAHLAFRSHFRIIALAGCRICQGAAAKIEHELPASAGCGLALAIRWFQAVRNGYRGEAAEVLEKAAIRTNEPVAIERATATLISSDYRFLRRGLCGYECLAMSTVRWGILSTAKIAVTKVIPGMQNGVWSEVTAIATEPDHHGFEKSS